MATDLEEYEKFMEKQRKKDLINAIKFIGKILKGSDKE